jgi:tetratricopeptide (TPR) repeat protein
MRRFLVLSLSSLAVIATLSGPVHAQEGAEAGAWLAARAATGLGDFRAGAYWYARALQGDPANQQLLDGAVLSSIGLGDFPAAAEYARRLGQTGARSQTAFLALTAEQAVKGEFAQLVADLDAGRSIGTVLDKLIVAWAQLGDGKMAEALKGFDDLSKSDGLAGLALYHKALALASAGDFEGAETILSGKSGGRIDVTRRGVIAHVQILSQLEQGPKALEILDNTFGTDPDPELDALRVQLRAGKPLTFDVVRNAQDGMAEVFRSLAEMLGDQADPGFLLLYTRVAAYLRPDLAEAVLTSAQILEEQGQLDLAAETFAQIPADSPLFHIAEMGRAETLIASDKVDAGIEALQALTRSHADLPGVHMALADALRRQERFADSIVPYDEAIRLIGPPEAHHWAVFFARGISHERVGDFVLAEKDLRKSLELSPDQPSVLNYLGYSFVDRGENLKEALGMIQRAVAAQPESGAITDSLAWAYFRLGRYPEAVEPMERASLLEPVDPIVTDHLGDVYWAVGRRLEAQFQWRRALSFDPEEKEATRIRKKLELGLDQVLIDEGKLPITPVVADGN